MITLIVILTITTLLISAIITNYYAIVNSIENILYYLRKLRAKNKFRIGLVFNYRLFKRYMNFISEPRTKQYNYYFPVTKANTYSFLQGFEQYERERIAEAMEDISQIISIRKLKVIK